MKIIIGMVIWLGVAGVWLGFSDECEDRLIGIGLALAWPLISIIAPFIILGGMIRYVVKKFS